MFGLNLPFNARLRIFSLTFALFFALILTASAQSLVISEFMAAGQFAVADEDGAYPDWVELHNSGDAALSLAGWHLTDEADEPAKWTLPAVTLPPGGYLLVFASGKNRALAGSQLHTSFALKADGEYLALTRPDGSVAFKFDPYPLQLPDVAYDDAGRFLGNPTPGAANDLTQVAIAAAPQFSEPHGFKSATFTLALTTETPEAQIHYTLNGTEPSETHGTVYAGPISIAKTTVVRAVAFTPAAKASPIVTRTFLFLADIVKQSPDGKAPPGWPKNWGENKTDYGMDPRITQRPPYKTQLRQGLVAIPSISIVMPLDALFSPENGIYSHPQERGREWERAASIELINPDGTPGFQSGCGLRIRGGASRDLSDPKHSLRVFFRRSYGASELEYPLFGPEGAPTSDKFDLRCDQISSWHWIGDPNDDFIRDQWGRDTQLAMGQPSGRGDFYHLYINGMYFGLFNTQERHDAAFAARYFGDDEDDYDVVKYDNTFGGTNDADGTIASWRRLHEAGAAGFETAAAYQRVQGNNPDGSRNPAYERLVDVENLIDYMLVGVYSAASDNPPSGGVQNNWGAIKSREGDFGFRFFVHDWELSMYDAENDNVVGEQPTENPFAELEYNGSNMWHVWQAMRFNADFRLRVADRVQRHFFDGGALTPEKAAARFKARMDEINFAVVGESARWGDAFYKNNGGGGGPIFEGEPEPRPMLHQQVADLIPGLRKVKPPAAIDIRPGPGGPGSERKLLTRQDWLKATRVAYLQNYFPFRTAAVLQQLRDGGLYPALNAPAVEPGSGNISPGQAVTLTNPNASGGIYFTLDGSDPREFGGAIAAGAQFYAAPVQLGPLKLLKARILDGETWSALVEARYENAQDFSGLQITEISYHTRRFVVFPLSGRADAPVAEETLITPDDYDFIELKNAGATPLDLTGLLFESGITYVFPAGTILPPGGFYVIGKNADAFRELHPEQTLDGVFTGRLSDNGEDLVLSAGAGVPLIELHYETTIPWPPAANGVGFTLVRADGGSPNNGENWRASTRVGGSPRADDPVPPPTPRVVVNELLARPLSGPTMIELANLNDTPADVSGWKLTNAANLGPLFTVPAGTVIAPRGFVALPFPAPEQGGDATIFVADAVDPPTGYAHGFSYDASAGGVSFGRLVNSEGDEKFVAQSAVTLGAANAGPRESEIVINEIHYHPPAGGDEFVELRSRGQTATPLAGWQLNGLAFTFPAGAELPAGALALVVKLEPEAFRVKYDVPADVQIFGPAPGALQDDGETVGIERPVIFPGSPDVFHEALESVRYNDKAPWPYEARGSGGSLQRPIHAPFADDPASWLGAVPTPGRANSVNAAPAVTLTSPLPGASITPPNRVTFTATAIDFDGTVSKVEFLVDSEVIGEVTAPPYTLQWTGGESGLHDLTARATDDSGNVNESAPVTILVQKPEDGAGLGLHAEYFQNEALEGTPFTRIDPTIDFQWSDIDPAPGIARTGFSVRWTGKFVPRDSGDTNLTIHCEGGVRLYLDDELVIDEWEGDGSRDSYAAVATVAGEPIDFRLEYRDGDGFAGIQVYLSEPRRFDQQLLPTGSLYLPTQDPNAFAISTPHTLPPAVVGQPYRLQFKTVHGTGPVTFRVVSVANGIYPGYSHGLPDGMTLSPSGVLAGTPTRAELFGIAIYAEDAAGHRTNPGLDTFFINVLTDGPRVRPTLTLTRPIMRASLQGDTVLMEGSSSSERGIQRVEYALNGNPWRPLTVVPQSPPVPYEDPTSVNFRATLDHLRSVFPGENTLLVRAIDSDGLASATITRRFDSTQFGPLVVSVQGAGSVSPEFVGTTRRQLGKTYTIRARPGRGHVLQYWQEDGFIGGADLVYTFTMRRDLHITAVFIPNPYKILGGSYGTIVGTELDRSDARGLFQVELARNGSFTARLEIGGRTFPIRGAFDPFGFFDRQLTGDGGIIFDQPPPRPRAPEDVIIIDPIDPRPPSDNLYLSMSVDFEAGTLTAFLNNFNETEGFTLTHVLKRRSWKSGTRPCPVAGKWSVTLEGGVAPQPTGRGIAHLAIAADGRATLRGALADGRVWTRQSRMDDDLVLPLYSALYGRTGSLSGELTFALLRGPLATGDIFWEKLANPTAVSFPQGFAFHLNASATPYTPPAEGAPFVSWALGDAVIWQTDGGVQSSFFVHRPSANVLELVPTSLSQILPQADETLAAPPAVFRLTGEPSSGIVRGTIREAVGGPARDLKGVLDQRDGLIRGVILGTPGGRTFELREHTIVIPLENP